jgi:hypothetical protein
MPDALDDAISSGRPFALLARDGETVEVLTGDVTDVALLADIPLHDASGTRAKSSPSCRTARSSSAASPATTTALRCAAS